MTTARISACVRVAVCAGFVVAMLSVDGCTEQASTKAPGTPEPTMDANLVLSNSAPAVGSTVDVFAQIGTATPGLVGSFTARIRYDSTYLRYQAEIPIADQTMRATNATSGLVRFAGAATTGVTSGRLAGYRFVVLRADAMRTLQLVVDELHTVARTDAASMVRATPNRVEVSP
jgi:Cohesin domain